MGSNYTCAGGTAAPVQSAGGYTCPTYKKYTSCSPGYYMTDSSTSTVPDGSSKPGNACRPCSVYGANYTCAGGTAAPQAITINVTCPKGQYLPQGKTACETCTAGNYCPGGTFNNISLTTGATSAYGLSSCPSAYSNSASGSSSINQCYLTLSAGQWVERPGRGAESCSAGAYCDYNGQKIYYSTSDCLTPLESQFPTCTPLEACVQGSYSVAGASACTACQNGTTTSGTGSTSCDATCTGAEGTATWANATWNSDNTVSNQCKVTSCDEYYILHERGYCTGKTYKITYIVVNNTPVDPNNLPGDASVVSGQFEYNYNSRSDGERLPHYGDLIGVAALDELRRNGLSYSDGYTWCMSDNWDPLSGCSNPITNIPAGTSGNITLYAILNPHMYHAELNLGGGGLGFGNTTPSGGVFTIDEFYGMTWVDQKTRTEIASVEIPFNYGVFDGYYTAQTGGDQIIPATGVLPVPTTLNVDNTTDDSVMLYAQYTEPTCRVEHGRGDMTNGCSFVRPLHTDAATFDNMLRVIVECDTGYSGADGDEYLVIDATTVGQTVFTGACLARTATVSFNANSGTGGQTATVTATYDAAMPALSSTTAPTRAGYTFMGWYDNADYTKGTQYYTAAGASARTWNKTANTTLYAGWSADTYTITYNLNGGTNAAANPATYNIETATITLANPTKNGYTFGGWYTESAFTNQVTQIAKGSTGNKTFHAKWTATPYTITYNLNGGTNASGAPTSYTIETATITLGTPTRAHSAFGGWYTEPTFKTQVTQIVTGSTGAKAFWAKWTCHAGYSENTSKTACVANTYQITFNANGGTGGQSANVTATYDSAMPSISTTAPTRTGYAFMGWYDNADYTKGTQYYTAAGASARTWNKTANTTLYAGWKNTMYTIRYNFNLKSAPGTFVEPITATCIYGADCTIAANTWTADTADLGGHREFTGWNTTKTGNGTMYQPGATVKNLTTAGETIDLYGIWGTCAECTGNGVNCTVSAPVGVCTYATSCKTGYENLVNGATANASCGAIVYPITYNLNGGTNASGAPTSYTIETATITLGTPTKTGYTFDGWYTESAFTNKVTQIAKGSTGNKTFYAKWTAKIIPVTLRSYDDTTTHQTVYLKYGTGWFSDAAATTAITTVTKPTRAGYTFRGYSMEKRADQTANLTGGAAAPVAWQVSYDAKLPGNTSFIDATTLYAAWIRDCVQPSNGSCTMTINATFNAGRYTTKCNDNYTMASGNGTYNPVCSGNIYAITLNATQNGGTGGTSAIYQVYGTQWTSDNTGATKITSVTMPTKANNVFNGYYSAATGGTQYITNSGAISAGNKTFTADTTIYAQYSAASCNVTHGSATMTISGNRVSCAVTCNTGYSKSGGSDTTATFTTTGAVGAATVSASCLARTATVSFNANSGTGGQMATVTATYDAAMPTISTTAPTRTGYTFMGWYDNATYTSGTQYYTAAGASARTWNKVANTTLYAGWKVDSYTCAAGQYLKAGATSCSSCEAGHACAGGSYSFNTSSIQGRTECSGRTQFSAAGAAKCSTVSTGYYTTGCTNDKLCTGQSQCTSGTWCESGVQKQCSSLTGVSVSGGTYTSAAGSSANTACKYTAPNKTIGGCKTVTTNTVTYTGTAWPATTYGVTANGGYIISGNNTAAATCTQCTGAQWSAGETATSCSACPAQTSGWTRNSGTGWTAVTQCNQTKSVGGNCSAGVLKQNATSTTAWGSSTISTPLQANPGSVVKGQQCEQCDGAVWSAGGTATSCSACPAQTSGWTRNSGTGWTAVTQCNQTKEVGGDCSAGVLKQNATSTTAWGASTISTPLQANPGSIVNGQRCVQCSGAKYSAGGTATSCTPCPAAESGWKAGVGGGWNEVTQCYETKDVVGCSYGQLKKNATSSTTWGTITISIPLQANPGGIVDGQSCKQCSAGTFSAGGTATSCTPCPTADDKWTATSPAGSTAYTACYEYQTPVNCASGSVKRAATSASKYSDTIELVDTLKSNPGYYAGTTATSCTICPAGSSCAASATAPTPCANWTYAASTGMSSCTACPALTSGWAKADSTGTGWKSHTNCVQISPKPANCAGGNLKQVAASNGATTWGASTVNSALSSEPGYYIDGTACSPCTGATYYGGGTATSCTPCPSIYTSNTTAAKSKAEQCTVQTTGGYYIKAAKDSKQTECDGGYYCPSATVAYGSTNTQTACPVPADHKRATIPAEYYTNSIANTYLSMGKRSSAVTQCQVLNTYNGTRGSLYDYVTYNTTTQKYDVQGTVLWFKVNPGYYLTTATACGTYAYYGVAKECDKNAYCPGKDQVECNSSNQATVQVEKFGLELCSALGNGKYATSDGGAAAKSTAACYLTTSNSKFVAAAGAAESACKADGWCPGGVRVNYGSTGGRNTCPTKYPSSAASSNSELDCYVTTAAGKYVATVGAGQVNCEGTGYYCPGGTNVYSGAYGSRLTTGGRTQCPAGYRDLVATASTTKEAQCTMNVAGGKYVKVAKESAASGTCDAGYAKAAHSVTYGNTSSCAACTGATYAASTGQALCTTCPTAKTYASAVKSYGYWNTGKDGDHTISDGCYATMTGTLSNGSLTEHGCYLGTDGDYGNGGGKRCYVHQDNLKCNAGYYASTLSNGYVWNNTRAGLLGNTCVDAGDGYYSPADVLTRNQCSALNADYTHSAAPRSSADSCYLTTSATKYVATAGAGQIPCAPAGYYCPGGTNVYYSGSGTNHPTTGGRSAASAGYFVAAAGASTQTACAVGSYTATTAQTACVACGGGDNTDATRGKTTTGVGQTSCNATCSNNSGVLYWKQTTWNSNNTVTNMCTATKCNANNFLENNACALCTSFADGLYPYSSGAAGGKTKCYAKRSDMPGYYIANVGDLKKTPCPAGRYSNYADGSSNNQVFYNNTSNGSYSCTVCPVNTYASATGSAECTACLDNYVTMGTSDTDHDSASKCKLICPGGSYVSAANSTECTKVGTGYWAAESITAQGSAGTRNACPVGLTTVGYGLGADEAGDCGRILHVGSDKLYLRSDKKTTPSLNVKINGTTFYGNMSPNALSMTSGTSKSLRIKNGDTTYSVYDDMVSYRGGSSGPKIKLDPNVNATSIVPANITASAGKTDWTATFNYGNVAGSMACTADTGTRLTVDETKNYSAGGTGANCWCQMTSPAKSGWLYISSLGTACADKCAYICAQNVGTNRNATSVRTSLFGSADAL